MTSKILRPAGLIATGTFLALASTLSLADIADGTGRDVLSLTRQDAQFSTLSKAIEASGLASELSAQGPVTIFAPTDEAFAKLPPAELEALMQPENQEKLKKILAYHVIPGKALEEDDLKTQRSAETASGESVKIALVRGRVRVDEARVQGEIDASNGVIVPIDRVLQPR